MGVVNGRVVSPPELDEADTFLGEARKRAAELSPATRDLTVPALDHIIAGVGARLPVIGLRRQLDSLRHDLETSLGAALDLLPAAAPSLTRGARVYQLRCRECHGESGRGDGPKAPRLDPPPANFTAFDSLRGSSPLDFFRKITVGVAGTEMREWESLLPLEDRWAVALFASGLRYSQPQRDRGGVLLTERCAACLETIGDFAATAGASDDSLVALLTPRLGPTLLSESDRTAVAAYARTAAAAELLGGDPVFVMNRTLAQTINGLNEAQAMAQSGARDRSEARALDAYLVFERLETPLRARDPRTAAAAEQAFRDFRATLAGGNAASIDSSRRAVEAGLERAKASLIAPSDTGMLFGQSLTIMLREGLEAILIVGALMAFAVKAGAPERKRDMLWGVVIAVLASLATAGLLATLFRGSAGHREAIEGIVMIVAAGVLFSVSYWLISKIEAKKWQAFVGGQIKRALSSGGRLALAAVAFLAVYREGFETVLFYAALFATGKGPGSTAAITIGILLGFGVLCLVYYAIQRWGMRLPLKPFFGVTSALLYLMAFSFSGQGIAELQEAGIVPATHVSWVPSVPALGIFPTTQTLSIQLLLAIAVVGALAWVFWLEPRTARRS